jgi:SulP family sulfate permease
MGPQRGLVVLVLTHVAVAAWAHPLSTQPALNQPRRGQKPSTSTVATPAGESGRAAVKASELVAQAKPTNRVTDIAAGSYSGLVAGFLNCVVVASIVFAPVGLPQMIGVQHALVGFVVTQIVVTRLTGVSALITVPSFEALPFMARFAVIASDAIGPDNSAGLLATVLAGSLVVSLIATAMLGLVSASPVDEVEKLLPPALQAGLFAAIGWSLYLLSYDTLGLGFGSDLLTWEAARLWLPANALGLGLWVAARLVDSPLLFPGFIVGTTALVHAIRLGTGTSVDAARDLGWLMAEAAGEPCTELWRAMAPAAVQWDVLFSGAALKELICAALFGPLVNTVLNFVLLGPMIKQKLDLRKELRAHSLAMAAGTMVGGYDNYISLSDTAVHRMVGGLNRASCYSAAAVGLLFLVAYPLAGVVGYVPTLVIAAICVYIGADFLWDNLVTASKQNGAPAALGSLAVLAVCVKKDMLWGSLLGIAGFQLAAWWQRQQEAE